MFCTFQSRFTVSCGSHALHLLHTVYIDVLIFERCLTFMPGILMFSTILSTMLSRMVSLCFAYTMIFFCHISCVIALVKPERLNCVQCLDARRARRRAPPSRRSRRTFPPHFNSCGGGGDVRRPVGRSTIRANRRPPQGGSGMRRRGGREAKHTEPYKRAGGSRRDRFLPKRKKHRGEVIPPTGANRVHSNQRGIQG